MGPRNSCVCVGGGEFGGGKFVAALREKRGLSLVAYVTIIWWWVVRSYYRGYFWFNIVIFDLIKRWKCALNWFIVEPVHESKLDISHLHGLRAIYSTHVFLLIAMCKWFSIDMKILHDTQTRHIHNIYYWNVLVGHVLVGGNPSKRCVQ